MVYKKHWEFEFFINCRIKDSKLLLLPEKNIVLKVLLDNIKSMGEK